MEGSNGALTVARTNNLPFLTNRIGNDGDLIALRQDGTSEGTISVSGSTVSYNGFTGTHWSRLADNSKPTILKGTILESLDAMVDWYQVKFTVTDKEILLRPTSLQRLCIKRWRICRRCNYI